jgi:hypothetical protein
VALSAKSSPDAVSKVSHPGQAGKSGSLDKVIAELSIPTNGGHRDPGDKAEAHTSEEELGITTPTKEAAND